MNNEDSEDELDMRCEDCGEPGRVGEDPVSGEEHVYCADCMYARQEDS